MNLILNNVKNYVEKIKDIDVDPINKNIIATGEKLIFIKNGEKIKEISGKAKKSEKIKYIKEENQLFVSDSFFVSTQEGAVLKCNSSKQKISEIVFKKDKIIEFLNFTTKGKIIYVENNILYSYDTRDKKVYGMYVLENSDKKGNYKIFINGENIVLKYREIHENSNTIKIFDEKLKKIFEIKTEKNHIYSIISKFKYIAGTSDGEIEIWDILEEELYNSIKLGDFKITYIESFNENYFIGNDKGELLLLDENFKIIKKESIFKQDIVKICTLEDELFILSTNGEIANYKILNDVETCNYRKNFIKKYSIHDDYFDFFTFDRTKEIEQFFYKLERENVEYTPNKENIFKAFKSSLATRKVVLIGKDPYFQKGVATGLAFEVKKESWSDHLINTSLKNILKLIYKTYSGKLEDINEIREKIEKNIFKILKPSELFEHWEKEGVLLINSALTTVVGKAGEHHYFWNDFTHNLIQFISTKNNRIIYLLWGKDAEIFQKDILCGDIIKHNHPAICGNMSNEKDFLNGNSFSDTAHIINWTGYIENKTIKEEKEVYSNKLF